MSEELRCLGLKKGMASNCGGWKVVVFILKEREEGEKG
jgi:hypothetical protein